MPLTLQQLLTPTTETEALDGLLATLRELGFRTTSWQTGSVQLSIVRAVARMGSGLTTTTARIAAGGLLGLSTGDWLDLIGAWFALPRLAAVATRGEAAFTSAASAPAHSITHGSIIYDRATGQRFATVSGFGAGVALVPGASVTIGVYALAPGVAGNVAIDSTLALVTPYSGVTATFVPLAEPDSDTWITTDGAEQESDDRYTRRLELRWAELTYAVGFRAYELWALTASASVTRVRVLQNYPTENLVRVVLANATGAATVGEVSAVDAYVSDDDRRAINDDVEASAADVNAQAITLAPRVRLGTTTQAEIEAAILALCNALPIGGTRIAGAVAGRLLRDAIIVAVGSLPGVTSVGLTAPAADVVLGGTDIVSPTITCVPEFFTGQV